MPKSTNCMYRTFLVKSVNQAVGPLQHSAKLKVGDTQRMYFYHHQPWPILSKREWKKRDKIVGMKQINYTNPDNPTNDEKLTP